MTEYFPFIMPDKSDRKQTRYTKRNMIGKHVLAARKALDPYHEIIYSYDILSARQNRVIEDHFGSADGGVTSFYVPHWGDPKRVLGIATANVTLNNVSGLSANVGDGGNRVLLWMNSGEYGNDSETSASVLTDKTKAWTVNQWASHKLMDTNGTEFTIASNTATAITVVSGSPAPGAYDIYRYESFTISSITGRVIALSGSPSMAFSTGYQFVVPVYTCRYGDDQLPIEATGAFITEISDNYGQCYSGDVRFVQKGTG